MPYVVNMRLTRTIQYLLLFCVLEDDLSTAQTISKLGPKKRGGGWSYTAQDVGGELQAMPVRWWYNWGNGIPDRTAQAVTAASGIDFVPMTYGNCCGFDDLPNSLPENATELLSFNEPNHWEESGLYPEQAAQMWPKLVAAAQKLNLRLGSPAAAPCGASCVTRNPFEWWDQFFGNCTDCQVDFMATHMYTCSPQYLQWYLNDMYTRYGRPIWLTELACPNPNGTLARQLKYARGAFKVLDEDDNVERYAWFAPHIGSFNWIGPTASLLEPDADPPQLTALGRIYVSSSAEDYMGSAEVESELAGAPAQLSAEDRAAITEALPEVTKAGSWIQQCASCLDASLELLLGPDEAHCRECGLISNATALRENLL